MVSIQQHLVMPMFADFVTENFNRTAELVDYIENLGLEPIEMNEVGDVGIVKCEAYRPYVIFLPGNNHAQADTSMYWGVHTPVESDIPVGWEKIHKLFDIYHNRSLRQMKDHFDNQPQVVEYPTKPIPFSEYLGSGLEARGVGTMKYYIMNQGDISSQNLWGQNLQIYALDSGKVCWGNLNTTDIYYIDEILELTSHFRRHCINWEDSPLEKYILLHKENIRLEMERIALLEKMERIKELTETHKVYISRKQRKYLKNRLDVINDKVDKGLYFDYNRLSILYDKADSYLENTQIFQTLNSIYVSFQEHYLKTGTAAYRQIFECIIDLFPEYDIITREQFYQKYPSTVGFESGWNPQLSNTAWVQELYVSGVDLSYYAVSPEELKAKQGITLAHETTICLDFGKVGGPLSKSMYYKKIEDGRPKQPNQQYFYLPIWAFIDKRG